MERELEALPSKLEHSTTHQINIKNQKKEMTTTNIIREKKWNRLHHLRGMSRARSAEIKNQGESNFAPPSYAESILYETEKVTPTKQNSSPSRPKSADSIFNKRKLPSPSFSFTDTHPRVYSANRALEFEDRLHREEIEYQQELVEYMAKKFQQTEKEKKLLNMIRKSYEKNPCVNYKIYQQKQDENRQKRQQRRVEHYQKWKIMNQQFEEYSKQEEENYQKNINNNINKTKISNIETLKIKLKRINEKWHQDHITNLKRKELYTTTRKLRESRRHSTCSPHDLYQQQVDVEYRINQQKILKKLQELHHEYEKKRKKLYKKNQIKYEKYLKEREESHRLQQTLENQRTMERIRLEYERNQQIQQEIQERKRINRKELKLNELKRQKDLENLFSTIPPTIKETKSSIVRVKSIKETKQLKLEQEIERKEYAEAMRKKYFYSKNRSGEATTAAATAAGGGINLRILLKRSVQETTPTM